MPMCAAYNCKERGVHRFPKNPSLRKIWENALKRKGFKATDSSRLCRNHFTNDDYIAECAFTGKAPEHNFLKKNVVPTMFVWTKEATPAAISRRVRNLDRCKKKILQEQTNESLSDPVASCSSVSVDGYKILQERANDSLFYPIASCSSVGEEVEIQTTDPEDSYVHINKAFTVGTQTSHAVFTSLKYQNDPEGISFHTGFESYNKFKLVFTTLCPMANHIQYYGTRVTNVSLEDQFLLTLMKLRQNRTIYDLSDTFEISKTSVSNIIITWLNFIHQMWSQLDIWPDRDLVDYYMPEVFKNHHSVTRVIVDGTELPIAKPKNPISQQASWSSYKNRNTLKVLVGATPGGLLSFCSQAYGGSTSDRQIVERSDLVDKCEPGDSIMADRGFNVQDIFATKSVAVNIPTFLKGKSQLSGLTVLHDRKLASQRVHIERLIGLTKTYKILQSELDPNYVPLASKIFFICLMCCNFREGIVDKKKDNFFF